MWLYPFPALIFLGLTLWSLIYIGLNQPMEAVLAAALIALGAAVYGIVRVRDRSG